MAKSFGISDLASLGFGQMGQLLETMDMMSKTWSAMALPAAMSPTLSLEELDKRIGDLRAIEQWLALNQNMLRSTIQGLEVQRGTIATLQAFGKAMGSKEAGAPTFDPERLASLFATMQQPGAPAGEAGEPASRARASDPARDPGNASTGATPGTAAATDEATGDGEPAASQGEAAQLAQAWWNMLNDQFQQVTSAALGGMAAASGTAKGAAPSSPPAADGASADAAKAAHGRRKTATTPATTNGGRKRTRRVT